MSSRLLSGHSDLAVSGFKTSSIDFESFGMREPQIGKLYIFRPALFIVECIENPLGHQVPGSTMFAGKTVHGGTLGAHHPLGSVSVTLSSQAFEEIDKETARAIMGGAPC